MKRYVLSVVLFTLLAVPGIVSADAAKMDLSLQQIAGSPVAKSIALGKSVKVEGDEALVDCFVKSTDINATADAITAMGGVVRTVLATILTADVPLGALEALSDREEVTALEASKPVTKKMNFARGPTNVDAVQAGTGLSQAYDGNAVLVGVVDDSINWTHADFGGSGDNSRFTYLKYSNSSGTEVVCSRSEITADNCNVPDGGGVHGTHVTGIAAGNDSTYKGVANNAWLGFVIYSAAITDADAGGTFATVVIDGVNSLFTKATALDLPAVANLSLGTSLGAHDGTSLFEQGLDELVASKQGRLIVNAAGNENVNSNAFSDPTLIGGIHAGIDVDTGIDEGARFVYFGGASANSLGATVEVWLADGNDANCVIDVKAYDQADFGGSRLPPTGPNATTAQAAINVGNVAFDGSTGTATDGVVKIDVATTADDPNNSKPHAIVTISPGAGGSGANLEDYGFDVIIRATVGTCTGDMWLYPDFTLYNDFYKDIAGRMVDTAGVDIGYTFFDGDSLKTITIPGTATDIITAGSYMARNTYVDIDGTTQDQSVFGGTADGTGGTAGQVSLFSSLGPTADGRNKPEVVAPGEPIIAALAGGQSASNALKGDATHYKLEGTSMASPYVSGVIALMLQKNNCLTVAQVKTALAATSNAGSMTSYTGDAADTYGAGLIDALALMGAISADTSCYSGEGFSGGGGGGGGGSCLVLVPAANTANALPTLVLLFGPVAIVWLKRRRKR